MMVAMPSDAMSNSGVTKLDSVTLDKYLSQMGPFAEKSPIFDLRSIELITPAALAQIAAIVHSLTESGHRL